MPQAICCSIATWPGMPNSRASRCCTRSRRLEPQVKNASHRPSSIRPRSTRSMLAGPLVPSEVGRGDDFGAVAFEQIDGNQQFRPARAEDRGDRRAVCLGGLRQRRQGREPRAATDRHDMRSSGSSVKPTPSGPMMSRLSPGCSVDSPSVPAPVDFIEKLDLPALAGRRRKGSSAAAGTAARLRCADTAVGRTGRARRRRKPRCSQRRDDDIRR